ncbi:MAG TPA: response regulator [Thermoanaerobaculia bacterium]
MRPEERVNILAVDDHPGKLLALSAILSELNQNVVTAPSGREALRHLLNEEFAVILLDVHMPGMDGFETAALIRQRKSTEHTPIIFVTSYPDDTHASRGYSLGAVDYILAPVDPDALKTKVMVFVELFKKTAQVKMQAQALEHRASQLHRLTQAALAINSALSPDQTLQVVTDFARDILGAHQAIAVAAPDQKWSTPRTAVSLSRRYEELGERSVLADRTALLSFLSAIDGAVRVCRGDSSPEWERFLASDRPARLGWLAAPLRGRDGRNMGLLHLLEKYNGEFTEDDEAILTQLAQMSSIAIENAVNAEAREANRIKDEFLTTLSHELRTPLAAILGWTRLLRSERLGSRRSKDALEVIERNVVAQTKLIDDLLDVSRIITGKLRLRLQTAMLSSVIEAAMESMRPAADGKKIEMRLENELPRDSDRIVGDPDRLQQIIWNLISNSIKFTPPRGRVTVGLSRRNGEFEIAVSDTGRGMTPEFLAHAFDRFRQEDSSTTRSHGGLGIGLAIARHLAELHGGSIAAESAGPDRGSRFMVLLPAVALRVDSAEKREPESVEAVALRAHGSTDLTGVKVLLVEDQWDSRDLMSEILRTAGCEVTAVGSVPEALEALPVSLPDVLVSDIGMPGEDGYSLLRRIRQYPAEEGGLVPAIAVSAYAREEDRIRSLSAGFQIHLAKPFEPVEMTEAVGRLARRDVRAGSEAGQPWSGKGHPQPEILVIEDNTDLREGLRELLEAWGHTVEVAADGLRGIERALEQRPRIALIDIGLPGLDGYEVARRIRNLLGKDEVVLVALTGHTGTADLQQAVAHGFDFHLPKPVPYDKLKALLASRLAVMKSSRVPDGEGRS